MTFLEFFNTKYSFSLSKGEKNSSSSGTGSLSNSGISHRHNKPLPGVNQITSYDSKHKEMVPRYLTKNISPLSKCIKTKQDQQISYSEALEYFNGDKRALPTLQEREKAIKGFGVCLVLNPDNKTYKLKYKGN
jgi:hypothetical protein